MKKDKRNTVTFCSDTLEGAKTAAIKWITTHEADFVKIQVERGEEGVVITVSYESSID